MQLTLLSQQFFNNFLHFGAYLTSLDILVHLELSILISHGVSLHAFQLRCKIYWCHSAQAVQYLRYDRR